MYLGLTNSKQKGTNRVKAVLKILTFSESQNSQQYIHQSKSQFKLEGIAYCCFDVNLSTQNVDSLFCEWNFGGCCKQILLAYI